MVQWLGMLATLTEDLALVLGAYTGQFITTCNSSSQVTQEPRMSAHTLKKKILKVQSRWMGSACL